MKTRWFDLLNIHQPRMSFPDGLDEGSIQRFLKSVSVDNSPASEFAGYVDRDWRRFVYTWTLCRHLTGKCLEIGASPYFTTALLKEYTGLDLVLSNYSPTSAKSGENVARWTSPRTGAVVEHRMLHDLFNVETDPLPYPDDHFDVTLFCEVVEHLTNDPLAALMEIRRVLKQGGRLVLTTPNSTSARNLLKIITGKSVYDRYFCLRPLWPAQPGIYAKRDQALAGRSRIFDRKHIYGQRSVSAQGAVDRKLLRRTHVQSVFPQTCPRPGAVYFRVGGEAGRRAGHAARMAFQKLSRSRSESTGSRLV